MNINGRLRSCTCSILYMLVFVFGGASVSNVCVDAHKHAYRARAVNSKPCMFFVIAVHTGMFLWLMHSEKWLQATQCTLCENHA